MHFVVLELVAKTGAEKKKRYFRRLSEHGREGLKLHGKNCFSIQITEEEPIKLCDVMSYVGRTQGVFRSTLRENYWISGLKEERNA